MHQIDLGVIIYFFKAILHKYLMCVETHLNIAGKAAKKLNSRLQTMLGKNTTSTGHQMSGKHECLLPLTIGVSKVFLRLQNNNKTSRHFRATDYRHLFLALPFLLHNLLSDEVDDYNRRKGPLQPTVTDPSAELIEVANTFLSWYRLFRRITLPKTAHDVTTLQQLSHRYTHHYCNYWHYCHYSHYSYYFHYCY